MTNIYFSISPTDFEKSIKEELWGCYKYIGIPFDVLYAMPIQDRKYYIMRHNNDVNGSASKSNKGMNEINGEALNAYAALEQKKQENANKRG